MSSITCVEKVTEVEQICVKDIITSEKDKRLNPDEILFVLQASRLRKNGKIVIDTLTKDICILFSENYSFFEDAKDIDHIIGPKDTISNELHIEKIKKYITKAMKTNPKDKNYQSLYTIIHKYEFLHPILKDKYIQDRAHFDETMYTELVQDIADTIPNRQEYIEGISNERAKLYTKYRNLVEQETTHKHLLDSLQEKLTDNQLLEQQSVQDRQYLHSKYQQTLKSLLLLEKKLSSNSTELDRMKRLHEYLDKMVAKLSDDTIRRKNKRSIQIRIREHIPGGIVQLLQIIRQIELDTKHYAQKIGGLQGNITQCQRRLEQYKAKLIDLYPPAKELFAITQDIETDIHNNTSEQGKLHIQYTQDQKEYEIIKQAKDMFIKLYDEDRLIKQLKHGSYDKKQLLDITKSSDIQSDTKALYAETIQAYNILDTLTHTKENIVQEIEKLHQAILDTFANISTSDKDKYDIKNLHQSLVNIFQIKDQESLEELIHSESSQHLNKPLGKKIQRLLTRYRAYHFTIDQISKQQGVIQQTIQNIQSDHTQRLQAHQDAFGEMGDHFASIQQNNATLAGLYNQISVIRKQYSIPRNQDDPRLTNYNTRIAVLEKENKKYHNYIDQTIKKAWFQMITSEKKLSTTSQLIKDQTTLKNVTDKQITDLLANPNHHITPSNIADLQSQIEDIHIKLKTIQENKKASESKVSDQTDVRYQSLIGLEDILSDIITHYQSLAEIIDILEWYLPKPGIKMTDTDRNIRNKKEILLENKNILIEMGNTVLVILENAFETNKALRANTTLETMYQEVSGFLDKNTGQ